MLARRREFHQELIVEEFIAEVGALPKTVT